MATVSKQIRILFIEDLQSDYELAIRVLRKENVDFISTRVESANEMLIELNKFKPQLIISDYSMPHFNGMEALKLALVHAHQIPFIMLTGSMNEETAVECMKAGATDYVIKERIKRLPFAVSEALEKSRLQASKIKAEQALIKSEERFRKLAENAQDLIFRYEFFPQRQFTYVSPSATRITGYTPHELYADPDLGLKMVHPGDKLLMELSTQNIENLIKPIALRWIKKDGTVVWVELINVYMFNNKGEIFAIEGVARDITLRKQAENKIIEMQQMAQATLDSISANLCVVNQDGFIISVNKSWNDFAQSSNANLNNVGVGANYFDVCEQATEPDKAIALQFLWGIHLVLRGDKNFYELEYEFHALPEKQWFLGRVTPFESSESDQKRVVIAHENITQRKLAENSVRESEERYSEFLNSTSDIAFIKDEKLRYIFINKPGQTFYGKSADEMIGLTDFELVEHEFAHNCSLSDKAGLEKMKLVISTEVVNDRIFESRKFPIKLMNGKMGIGGFIRDITEIHNAQKVIQESENKYRKLVENSLVGVFTTNTKGEFLFANLALCDILEFESPKTLIKTEASKIYSNPADREVFLKALHLKNRISNYEVEMVTAKGNVKNIIVSAALSKNIISGMLLDITDRKRAELEILEKNYEIETQNEEYRVLNEELLTAKQKIEESNRLKTAFLQNLSHEIRTPMNGILGFTQLLKDKGESKPEKTLQYLDLIEKSGERLLNLISDLVEISKIETGLITLNTEEFNVNETLQEVFAIFVMEAQNKGISLVLSTQLPSASCMAVYDKYKVYQILSNLLKNAIKFTDHGAIQFGCELKASELLFTVKDTGIGIEPSKRNVIFERFIQADTSISRGYEGAGLGLSISKAFVEAMGGRIWVESNGIEKGSTFIFTLPYFLSKNENKNYIDMELSVNFPFKSLNVLVVEDDVVSRMLLNEILKECNFTVSFARNGKEAVDIIETDKTFDLILMDLKMPVMNGFEATHKIRELGFIKPIIAQTAYASEEEQARVKSEGFTSYLSKPIRKVRLIELLLELKGAL